jgi:GTP cyclohydrolase IB
LDQIVSSAFEMPDVQAEEDGRCIPIQRVGIKALRHPLHIARRDGRPTASIATWTLDVQLPAEQRGTHMSRFVALIEAFDGSFSAAALRRFLPAMLAALEAREGHVEVSFPFFLAKTAPVSGVKSTLDYDVTLIGDCRAGLVRIFQRVLVPITSLCPCSKKISDYGAHNQRSHLIIEAELDEDLPIEDLIRVAEDEASCEVWGLLKRADEKFVTERAYENPKFAEDIVRDVAHRLNRDARIAAYKVEVENFESIHNHSAFALIEHDKRSRA